MAVKKLEKQGRKISWQRIVSALAITIIVFSAGLLVGNAITSNKVDDILSLEKEARLLLESLELEERLLDTMPCANPSMLSAALNDLGVKLIFLESQYDKGDPRILDLKKPYTILEVRHYLQLREMVQECNEDYTLVLFFYSNQPDKIKLSEEQGFVLDYLQKKYTTDKVKIYSFDTDLDLELIESMKKLYGVDKVPSMIIDDKLFIGFHDKGELEELLDSKMQ